MSTGFARRKARREPGPSWAPHGGVGGGGGGRRVSCGWSKTSGSHIAHPGFPGRWPGFWPCVSLPVRLLGLLGLPRGAGELGVRGAVGAGRGGLGVVAGADEDAGLSRGSVGPRVQRAGALFTPEAAAMVQPPVGQVALHQVHVLPADAAGAADGAGR